MFEKTRKRIKRGLKSVTTPSRQYGQGIREEDIQKYYQNQEQ